MNQLREASRKGPRAYLGGGEMGRTHVVFRLVKDPRGSGGGLAAELQNCCSNNHARLGAGPPGQRSPIPDDKGGIVGMLCVVIEDTERTIGERRLRTLRELAARTPERCFVQPRLL